MKLKTYTASTMNAALALVKRDLGSDAVILHTRNYRKRGIFGLAGPTVVEITAAHGEDLGRERERVKRRTDNLVQRKQAIAAVGATMAATSAPQHATLASSTVSMDASSRQGTRTAGGARDVAEAESAAINHPLLQRAYGQAIPARRPEPPSAHDAARDRGLSNVSTPLEDDMRAVKQMVVTLMQQQRRSDAASKVPDRLFEHYQSLLEQEVAEELASEVVQRVEQELADHPQADEKVMRQAMLQTIMKMIPTESVEAMWVAATVDKPRTIALVGPTGVGKTTTIAKLAANLKLKHRKQVALVTLDTYRIAAVEQLRTYADIIGTPLYVASDPAGLQAAIRQCQGAEIILIDTAGRSQRDDPKLAQLGEFIEVAAPDEVHLVISSTATQKVIMETVERFSKVRIDRMILTKLDEAVSFGVVLNVLRQVNKSLSFVTTGQEVPHHIEVGEPSRLADLVMGGRL